MSMKYLTNKDRIEFKLFCAAKVKIKQNIKTLEQSEDYCGVHAPSDFEILAAIKARSSVKKSL